MKDYALYLNVKQILTLDLSWSAPKKIDSNNVVEFSIKNAENSPKNII